MSRDLLVYSSGPKGVLFCAPTYKQFLEGAKLAPRSDAEEVVVTVKDVKKSKP